MPAYFIRAGEAGPVKIGKAKNPPRRMATFQTAHYEQLTLVRTVPGYTAEEAWLRQHYRHLHIRGEWHHWCESMLQVVVLALPPAPTVAWNPKPYVTRPLTERDQLIVLPKPFGWQSGNHISRINDPDFLWSQALHSWMIEHQHTPQTLCSKLGVVPITVGGWVGWGSAPQKVPGQRLVIESRNALFGPLQRLRPALFEPAAA